MKRRWNKNKLFCHLLCITGALTIPIEGDATFALFCFVVGVLVYIQKTPVVD